MLYVLTSDIRRARDATDHLINNKVSRYVTRLNSGIGDGRPVSTKEYRVWKEAKRGPKGGQTAQAGAKRG